MDNNIIAAAIGIIGAVLGAIAGGLGTYYIEKLKIKNIDFQRRQQAFSQLKGLKFRISQIYASTYQSKMLFDYGMARMSIYRNMEERYRQERLRVRNEELTELINEMAKIEQETLRLRNEITELINETARIEQNLWETIGLILVLFPSTTTLHEKIAPLDRIQDFFRDFEHRDIASLREIELESWKKTTKIGINKTVKQRIEEPLDALLNYLKEELVPFQFVFSRK